MDIIEFYTDIIKDQVRTPGEQHLRYNIKMKKQVSFDIIRDISDNVTLVQLMDSADNFDHAVSIVRYWIFESNYKKALPLTLDSLNIICSLSKEEGVFTIFETVLHAVIYINNKGKLMISDC